MRNVIIIIIKAAIIMMTMLMRICLPEVTFKPLSKLGGHRSEVH